LNRKAANHITETKEGLEMSETIQKHKDFWWRKLVAGIGFALAAAFLLRMLLNDWVRLVIR